jgi:hypothetical protein
MSELTNHFKRKWFGKTSSTNDIKSKMELKSQIMSMCNRELVENKNKSFIFEVSEDKLHLAVIVITDEPLKSLYNIIQQSESLFKASLVEVDL